MSDLAARFFDYTRIRNRIVHPLIATTKLESLRCRTGIGLHSCIKLIYRLQRVGMHQAAGCCIEVNILHAQIYPKEIAAGLQRLFYNQG